MPAPSARDRFLGLLRAAVPSGALVKLTLGKHRGAEPSLQNLFVRPVALKSGPHLAFVWRHANRDITKNHAPDAALALLEPLIGGDFLDAHLFTTTDHAQFESQPDGTARLKVARVGQRPVAPLPATAHDRAKEHPIPARAPWLQALGVTNDHGRPRQGMADKFRQIQKFAELLSHLLAEAFPAAAPPAPAPPLRVVDAGSGKGYLTFALAHLLGPRAHVLGLEARPELVDLCNRVAREHGLAHLSFRAGRIAEENFGEAGTTSENRP
ncbi:MAG: methyltransferase, partial [Verrucomicrobia bacterium]|nr:methyltransferase [Verrucomicrobiota bacterium]